MDDIISNLNKIVEQLVKKSQELGDKSWLSSKKWKLIDIVNNLKTCIKKLNEMK